MIQYQQAWRPIRYFGSVYYGSLQIVSSSLLCVPKSVPTTSPMRPSPLLSSLSPRLSYCVSNSYNTPSCLPNFTSNTTNTANFAIVCSTDILRCASHILNTPNHIERKDTYMLLVPQGQPQAVCVRIDTKLISGVTDTHVISRQHKTLACACNARVGTLIVCSLYLLAQTNTLGLALHFCFSCVPLFCPKFSHPSLQSPASVGT